MRSAPRIRPVHRGRWIARFALVAMVTAVAASCSGTTSLDVAQKRVDDAKQAVESAKSGLEQARSAFCVEAKDYIAAIDRYGKAFTDHTATVGDLKTLGTDLAQPRASTASAAQAVLDAHEALNAANVELAEAKAALSRAQASATGSPEKTSAPSPKPSSTPTVPQGSIDRVRAAEAEFEAATEGVSDQTPVVQAAETVNAAAFSLEVSWLNLFSDAGCLTDEQSKEAADAVREYTTALQKDLKAAGYYDGEVDGVYGPETVSAVEDLQKDAGLPVTGLVDRATSDALADAVAAKQGTKAVKMSVEAASVQTALKLAGYWDGPIDGEWTPELTDALKQFQKDLGVEPTGEVDAATLAALEEALSGPSESPSPTPTSS